jgi:hypothetical protein
MRNCQTIFISGLDAFFYPIEGDLIGVLINDINSSHSCNILSVSLVDAILLIACIKNLKKHESTKPNELLLQHQTYK